MISVVPVPTVLVGGPSPATTKRTAKATTVRETSRVIEE
jgi:hypothetical protein